MQIVIDIDENVFTRICDNSNEEYGVAIYDIFDMAHSIRNGILLPKGHGDIIDRDELFKYKNGGEYNGIGFSREYVYVGDICNAPTIIEADKESEDE